MKFAMSLVPKPKRWQARAVARGCMIIRQSAFALGCCRETETLPDEMDEAVRRHGIPGEIVAEYVEACVADAATTRYATWNALKRHCERVGGNAAMMIASVLGVTHSDGLSKARAAGAAMRLTGILRDLNKDLPMGRVYLPIEDLAKARVPERKLIKRMADAEAVVAIVGKNVKRARELLAIGGEGLKWIAPDGSRAAAGLLTALTAAMLDDIERSGALILMKPPQSGNFRLLRRIGEAWRMARAR